MPIHRIGVPREADVQEDVRSAPRRRLDIRTILLPLKFDERSTGAARYAVDLARSFGAEVILLHVAAPARPGEDFGQSRIEQEVGQVLQAVRFRSVVVTGNPADRITELARSENAELILMPTRGRRRWHGLRVDSITARVVQKAHCPVWTSTKETSGQLRISRVLCALALGPGSRGVLEWASQIADRFEAGLSIIHSIGNVEDVPGSTYYELDAARKAWARQDIAALQQEVGSQADVWVETGSRPEQSVARIANLIGADLVVAGKTRAPWLVGKLWTRAYDIVREAPCPVVVC